MMTLWDEIRGKVKHAYNETESDYEKHHVSAVDKVKERSLLNAAVKMSLYVKVHVSLSRLLILIL